MTKQDKLARIYEVIAPREVEEINETWVWFIGERTLSIWPVMIGDVIDYIESKNIADDFFCVKYTRWDEIPFNSNIWSWTFLLYKKRRLPIDEQSDKCIDFVFDILDWVHQPTPDEYREP